MATLHVHLDPHIVSFIFSVSLIVAQFTIFSSFRVLKFQSRFEALNDIFLGKMGATWVHGPMLLFPSCSSRIDISNEILCASNRDRMPKLRPWEVDVPIYPNRAHNLAFHLLRLGFWMFRVLHCF